MIIISSPAKTFRKANKGITTPMFIDRAVEFVDLIKTVDYKVYFKINDNLSAKVGKMYSDWNEEGTMLVLDGFYGLQFKQIDSTNLSKEEREYAYSHLYILSGLYGLLRSSDSICPYRLDADDKLNGDTLAAYYYPLVNDYLKGQDILNLASNEYSQMLDENVVNVHFLEHGKSKGTINKIMRGKLIKYCINNFIDEIEEIKRFEADGYSFNELLSNKRNIYFTKEI